MERINIYKRILRRLLACAITLMAFFSSSNSLADEEADREQLARISYELKLLQRMVNDAAVVAENKGRVRFRYDLLSRDVQLVQKGIDEHLNAPKQPRTVQPLKGDYRN